MSAPQSGASSSNAALGAFIGAISTAKEKWDASGANEAMSRMSANLPQGTKEYISITSSQVLDRKRLRSVAVFFGVGEERPWFVEKSPALLMARLRHNLQFFYLNYLLMAGVLFCLTLITSPTTIIGMGLLGAAWMYIIRQTSSGSLQIYGITISQTQATIGMTVVSFFILMWLLSSTFWWTLSSSGFLTLVHSALRDASMHQDGEDQVDMVGEVGEDAAFLNVEAPKSGNMM